MYIKIGNFTVYISFYFAVFLAFAANIAGEKTLFLSLLFSFVHETVHLAVLYFSGIKKAQIRLYPAGIKICCENLNLLSYKKTVFSALSAPFFNIISGAVFFLLHKYTGAEFFYPCAGVNFLLGAINLLPLSFLDGGRALEALLSVKAGQEKVQKIMKTLALWSLVFLCLLFFAGFITGKIRIFLLFFCVYCLVGTLTSESK